MRDPLLYEGEKNNEKKMVNKFVQSVSQKGAMKIWLLKT